MTPEATQCVATFFHLIREKRKSPEAAYGAKRVAASIIARVDERRALVKALDDAGEGVPWE